MSTVPDEKSVEAMCIWKHLLQLLECNVFLGKARRSGPGTLTRASGAARTQKLTRPGVGGIRQNTFLKFAVTEQLMLAT